MARTYLSGSNSRGREITAANSRDAHLRGWNAGVAVYVRNRLDGADEFAVYMTKGSNGGTSTFLGTVTDTPDGPQWTPAGKE